MENGGSIKTPIHSQSKKRKYVDAERVAAVSNKINRNLLKGKQLETSQNLGTSNGSHSAKSRPKKNKNNVNQHNKPKLVQDSQDDLRITKFQDKSKGMKSSLYNGTIKKENEPVSDYGGADPLSQQRKDNTQSSKKMSSKKPAANDSRGKVQLFSSKSFNMKFFVTSIPNGLCFCLCVHCSLTLIALMLITG